MRSANSAPGPFSRALGTSGIAALEFALICPVLLLLAFGSLDLSRGWLTWRRVTQTAQSTAEIATAMAVQFDGSNQLTAQQATTASTAIFAIIPGAQNDAAANFSVAMSEVVFTPTIVSCTSGCTYTANIAWSRVLQGAGSPRACGTLASTPDSQAPSLTGLPVDAFGAISLLIVDVTYEFRPLMVGTVSGPFTMRRTAYLPPRSGTAAQWTRLVDPNSQASNCNGFS